MKTPRRQRSRPAADPSPRLEASADWNLVHLPAAAATAASPRRRAEGGDATPALPEAMTRGEFEVLDVVEAMPASPARRSASASEVPLRATVPTDAPVLLVVRQASGALSFHRPESTAMRRAARRGATGTMEVEFMVPVLPGDPAVARRGILGKVSAILVKLAKKAMDLLADPLAERAVPWLSRRLEERLWKNRPQGWLRVTQAGLTAGRLDEEVPDFPPGERGLLFLHGTFSHAASAFRDLATDPFFDGIQAIYGRNIFAFNHFTFSATPEENVRALLKALPPGKNFAFDVITHSRGGLVLRTLGEAMGEFGIDAARIRLGNVVLVASPNGGTPLASPRHWEEKLAWMANLLEMLPEHPFVTAADWLANALVWFADKVVGNAPGLAAMDADGDVIAALQDAPGLPAGARCHALVSNYHPDQRWWSRLADMGVDRFFGGANDLVVPTEGGWRTEADAAGWLPGGRIGCFGPGGNLAADEPSAVTHVSFFRRPEAAAFILRALRGEPHGLREIDPRSTLSTRTRRGGATTQGSTAAPGGVSSSIPSEEKPPARDTAPPTATLGLDGWNNEDDLFLTVVAQAQHAEIEGEDSVPLLLATYGSARVAVPFYVRGTADNAGQRWHRLIAMHRFMVGYANGREITYTLPGEVAISTPTEEFLQVFGRALFDTLFPGEVRRLYDAARFRHDKRRLNIIFTSMIPWVADFPWEFAFDFASETFLATADVRFVRNVLSPMPADRIEPRQALRILVVSAQPTGSVPLSIDEERQYIAEAFKPLTSAGLVSVEVIPRATPKLLHEAVRERAPGDEFDIVHFIGHGEFDGSRNTGYVLFEDEGGPPLRLSASQLLDILRSRGIRIVFLNACETGRGEGAEYNRGVAMALVSDGIPAVVANQYSVLDRAASLFSLHFYACLACGLRLGDAMREARIAIRYSGAEPMDWGVPVLFARNPNARLAAPRKARSSPSFPTTGGFAPAKSSLAPRATRAAAITKRPAASSVPRPLKVSVWDVANALPYRENLDATLVLMNGVQDQFEFRLERIAAPRSFWTPDKSKSADVAYLRAERMGGPMEDVRMKIGADHLFCVTDLPLRDESTTALYFWEKGSCSIFSIWGFEPPLQGPLFQRGLVNTVAFALAAQLDATIYSSRQPKFALGYYNAERDIAHLAGRLRIEPKTRRKMVQKGKITAAQLEALETLLALFHHNG